MADYVNGQLIGQTTGGGGMTPGTTGIPGGTALPASPKLRDAYILTQDQGSNKEGLYICVTAGEWSYIASTTEISGDPVDIQNWTDRQWRIANTAPPPVESGHWGTDNLIRLNKRADKISDNTEVESSAVMRRVKAGHRLIVTDGTDVAVLAVTAVVENSGDFQYGVTIERGQRSDFGSGTDIQVSHLYYKPLGSEQIGAGALLERHYADDSVAPAKLKADTAAEKKAQRDRIDSSKVRVVNTFPATGVVGEYIQLGANIATITAGTVKAKNGTTDMTMAIEGMWFIREASNWRLTSQPPTNPGGGGTAATDTPIDLQTPATESTTVPPSRQSVAEMGADILAGGKQMIIASNYARVNPLVQSTLGDPKLIVGTNFIRGNTPSTSDEADVLNWTANRGLTIAKRDDNSGTERNYQALVLEHSELVDPQRMIVNMEVEWVNASSTGGVWVFLGSNVPNPDSGELTARKGVVLFVETYHNNRIRVLVKRPGTADNITAGSAQFFNGATAYSTRHANIPVGGGGANNPRTLSFVHLEGELSVYVDGTLYFVFNYAMPTTGTGIATVNDYPFRRLLTNPTAAWAAGTDYGQYGYVTHNSKHWIADDNPPRGAKPGYRYTADATTAWAAQAYNTPFTYVRHLNKNWVNTAAAAATDVPGTANVWVEKAIGDLEWPGWREAGMGDPVVKPEFNFGIAGRTWRVSAPDQDTRLYSLTVSKVDESMFNALYIGGSAVRKSITEDKLADDIPRWRGNWVGGANYIVGDEVRRNNHIWKCITANSDATFQETKWQNLSLDTTLTDEAFQDKLNALQTIGTGLRKNYDDDANTYTLMIAAATLGIINSAVQPTDLSNTAVFYSEQESTSAFNVDGVFNFRTASADVGPNGDGSVLSDAQVATITEIWIKEQQASLPSNLDTFFDHHQKDYSRQLQDYHDNGGTLIITGGTLDAAADILTVTPANYYTVTIAATGNTISGTAPNRVFRLKCSVTKTGTPINGEAFYAFSASPLEQQRISAPQIDALWTLFTTAIAYDDLGYVFGMKPDTGIGRLPRSEIVPDDSIGDEELTDPLANRLLSLTGTTAKTVRTATGAVSLTECRWAAETTFEFGTQGMGVVAVDDPIRYLFVTRGTGRWALKVTAVADTGSGKTCTVELIDGTYADFATATGTVSITVADHYALSRTLQIQKDTNALVDARIRWHTMTSLEIRDSVHPDTIKQAAVGDYIAILAGADASAVNLTESQFIAIMKVTAKATTTDSATYTLSRFKGRSPVFTNTEGFSRLVLIPAATKLPLILDRSASIIKTLVGVASNN